MSNKNYQSFTITRSMKPIKYEVMSLVIVSDALYVFLVLLLIGLRNALGLDATLTVLLLTIFAFKSLVTVFGVYKMLQGWLGVTYYVVDGQLFIQSNIRRVNSSGRYLSDLRNAYVDQSYRGFKGQDYGSVKLEFASGASIENIVLTGVDKPDIVAKQLLSQSKNGK